MPRSATSQPCPLCAGHLDILCSNARGREEQLATHLERAHLAPCFEGPGPARPWRCPICNDKRRSYGKSLGLAQHFLKVHAAASSAPGPPRPPIAGAATGTTTTSQPGAASDDARLPQATLQAAVKSGALLEPPRLPWLPRPTSTSRAPASVLLASWNLEHFSLMAAESSLAARKVANVCATLRQLCAAEGGGCAVVVALQEVFSAEAVNFMTAYLNEREKPAAAAAAGAAVVGTAAGGEGGGGEGRRTWHCVTSEPLGNNAERAAFLWSGPPSPSPGANPPPPSGAGRWLPRWLPCGRPAARPPPAPLFADPEHSFRLLREEGMKTVLRGRQEQVAEGRFIRSPFFGLFRVGWANLLVLNVHLAADPAAARSEVAALNRLAAAIEAPNCRLLRRRLLGGLLRGRRRRGLVAIAGDFNCSPPGRPVAPTVRPPACAVAGGGSQPEADTRAGAEAGGVAADAAAVEVSVHVSRGALPAPGPPAQAAPIAAARAGKAAAAGENGWDTLSSKGWVNVLAAADGATAAGPGAGAASSGNAGGGKSQAAAPLPATNWRAKQPRALDAICVRADDVAEGVGASQRQGSGCACAGSSCSSSGGSRGGKGRAVVTGRGVCAPPPYVDPQQPAVYPNHLLCWVRLDLTPLQQAPGKPRALLAPARLG